ncbi:Na/Pi symporter [Aestuariibacter halophilus]|uniref:Na/Pi symporter n=1 Tax=Fluctibacter halophilus TaxID=226011 RepID=A0ABS8GG28_9ALTE|nr:Na/Pi symporter [Aestuariibacter halophilus]MCC2618136.1 Na/Pi symporter [Aestuariibacter halophilus]
MSWLGFFAGIGIFLIAMQTLEQALQRLSGKGMRNLLQRTTHSPVGSVLSGGFSTAILQSSSMVGLMVLAMVGSGLLPLYNAIGMMLGANLGTTMTGWLVTILGFKLSLSVASIPLMGLGGLVMVSNTGHGRRKAAGQLAFALGLLLFGLDVMKDSVAVLSERFDPGMFADAPLWLLLVIGCVFAAIIQSSSATMLITLNALSHDVISLPMAAAIIVGADLGTTSTLLLGGMTGTANKKRVAMAHLVFNVFTAVLAYALLLPFLPDLLAWFGMSDPLYSLVFFHSLFNLIGVLVMMPLLKPLARRLEQWFVHVAEPTCAFLADVPARWDPIGQVAALRQFQILFQRVLSSIESRLYPPPQRALTEPSWPVDVQSTRAKAQVAQQGCAEMTQFLVAASTANHHSEGPLQLLHGVRALQYALQALEDLQDEQEHMEGVTTALLKGELEQRLEQELSVLEALAQSARQMPPAADWRATLERLDGQIAQRHDAFVVRQYQFGADNTITVTDMTVVIGFSKALEQLLRHLLKGCRDWCELQSLSVNEDGSTASSS